MEACFLDGLGVIHEMVLNLIVRFQAVSDQYHRNHHG
jgi:hypothetical protein